MFKFRKLSRENQEELQQIYRAYSTTFPEDETRNQHQFLSLTSNPNSGIYFIINDDKKIGYVIIWRLRDCTFVEHFEVFEEYRNKKFGARILSELKNDFGEIVLESEPAHLNEIAARRLRFYTRNGFYILEKNYVQPSYDSTKEPVPLWLLSTNSLLDKAAISAEIYSRVYE